ncbi:hypothetical protein FB45DRAFT_875266 [Roridomyces roridus]|uniref:Uncharacterized protein n=1 Tax=Roridomyces roridus TaxID=1738132 RepID=A0AAD7B5Y2_9AGAR|nr:hypothetical protein FB45DRAFT_875266 [Roridomyces roridus]
MTLLALPAELRAIIYDFVFPAPQSPVQIVPFEASLPACRLNLPTHLYLVCKLINEGLGPLTTRVRRLDLTYIIRGRTLTMGWRPELGQSRDDDYEHFTRVMRFAERVRLVGAGPVKSLGRPMGSPARKLQPGPVCALKILEIQPRTTSLPCLSYILLDHMGAVTTHPDVAAKKLQVRLIRDMDDLLQSDEEVKDILREYHRMGGTEESGRPIYVDLALLDKPPPKMDVRGLDMIESWLDKFQNLSGDDIRQRTLLGGPLHASAIATGLVEEDDTWTGRISNSPMSPSLLTLPCELRSLIYAFLFPAPRSPIQIVPYVASSPACRLALPTSLYLVCKLIQEELGPLPARLTRLDLTYLIRASALLPGWRPEYLARRDDDYKWFGCIMQFATRVRLVGLGPVKSSGRTLGSPARNLLPGPHCALKVLEVQPRMTSLGWISTVLMRHMGRVTTHPDVVVRGLEVGLVRDMDDLVERDEDVRRLLRGYYEDAQQGRSGATAIRVTEEDIAERPAPDVDQEKMDKIEAWLKEFQEVEDLQQRTDVNGPLWAKTFA